MALCAGIAVSAHLPFPSSLNIAVKVDATTVTAVNLGPSSCQLPHAALLSALLKIGASLMAGRGFQRAMFDSWKFCKGEILSP